MTKYEVGETKEGRFWSPSYKGITFATEKELHDWVKTKHRKIKWNGFLHVCDRIVGSIIRISFLFFVVYGIIKLIKFCWYL